jgi:hypothetical protein
MNFGKIVLEKFNFKFNETKMNRLDLFLDICYISLILNPSHQRGFGN